MSFLEPAEHGGLGLDPDHRRAAHLVDEVLPRVPMRQWVCPRVARLRCVFEGSEVEGDNARPSWQLELSGTLADNLFAQLLPSSGGSDPGPRRQVEVLMWHRVWQIARRPLAASLATVLGPEGTQAAMILSAPERVWLAPELDEQTRGLSLSVLVALRLIPLGFEL